MTARWSLAICLGVWLPLLGQGGVAAPSRNGPVPWRRGRGGLFNSMVERGQPRRQLKQFFSDGVEYGIGSFEDQAILESEDLHSQAFQERRTCFLIRIGNDFIMRLTVQLDNQSTFRTVKINDVRTDAMLTSKLFTVERTTFKMYPQCRLCCCGGT